MLEITGLRNPCAQIDGSQPGLLRAVAERLPDGSVLRKTGVMAVVLADGEVAAGDPIVVEIPALPHRPLAVV